MMLSNLIQPACRNPQGNASVCQYDIRGAFGGQWGPAKVIRPGRSILRGVIVSWFQESWPIEVVMTLHSISSQAENLVSLT